MSFPSGVLRWTGNWSATITYRYGDIALASTNVSYACGVPTSLNSDPATQPSDDWFPFPPSGGGGGSTWSQFPATQDVIMGENKIADSATGGDGRNTILLSETSQSIEITARRTIDCVVLLNAGANGGVSIGGDNVGSRLAVNQILNNDDPFGTVGQVLTSDGTKIGWADPPTAIQTYNIQQGQHGVNGTEVVVWNTVNFTSGVACSGVVNFNVECQKNNNALSDLLTLELFLVDNDATSSLSLGTVNIKLNSTILSFPATGFIGTFSRTFDMSPGVSYKLQLQGTCSTDIGVPTAWIVLSSTGYFQVGFPPATV